MDHIKIKQGTQHSSLLTSLCNSPKTFSLLVSQSNQLAKLTGDSCNVGQTLKKALLLCDVALLKNIFTHIIKKINPNTHVTTFSYNDLSAHESYTNIDLTILVIQHLAELKKYEKYIQKQFSNTIIIAPKNLLLPPLYELGVVAAVTLESDAKIFLNAFIDVLKGKSFMHGFDVKQTPNDNSFNLTKRQKDVLRFMYNGKSNSEIAKELGISISTVKKHCALICKALGVKTRTQACQAYQNII